MTELEAMERDLLFRYIPARGQLALDIGANEGFWSKALSSHFAWVHAYEPQEGLTTAFGNVMVFNSAVGRAAGMTKLKRYANSGHATIVEREDVGYGPLLGEDDVEVIALDDWYGDTVGFIKIDVEGAEADVLRGAQVLLEEVQPPLVIEIHSAEARRQVIELLPGYEIKIIPNPVAPDDPRYCWIYAR